MFTAELIAKLLSITNYDKKTLPKFVLFFTLYHYYFFNISAALLRTI